MSREREKMAMTLLSVGKFPLTASFGLVHEIDHVHAIADHLDFVHDPYPCVLTCLIRV